MSLKKEITSIGPPIEIRILEKELSQLLEKHGFQLEKTYEVGPYSYLSVFSFKE